MDLNFNKNEDYNKLLVTNLNKRLAQVKLGGGKLKIEKEHEVASSKIMIVLINITFYTFF